MNDEILMNDEMMKRAETAGVSFNLLSPPERRQGCVKRMVERSLPQVLGGDEARALAEARRLSYVSPFLTVEFDALVRAYASEMNPTRKEHLARTYREITGSSVESRLYQLND